MIVKKKLSAIVIMKNEALAIEKCLLSLIKECRHTFLDNSYELIIVDSSSSDNSVGIALDILDKLNVECYLVLKLDSNRFTAALGREVGKRYARGEWLLFLDGDMIIFQGFLRKALDCMNSEFNSNIIGLVGNRIDVFPNQETKKVRKYPRIIEPDGTTTHPGGGLLIRSSAFENASYIIEQKIIEEESFASALKAKGLLINYININMYVHYNYKIANRTHLNRFRINTIEFGRSLALVLKKNCKNSNIVQILKIFGNKKRHFIIAPCFFAAVFLVLLCFQCWLFGILWILFFLGYMRRKTFILASFLFFLIKRIPETRANVKVVRSRNYE